MPVYEYACTACGERTEAKQSFDDPPLEECPACGGKLRKLYSPVGIVFKGSGFYATDARKKAGSTSGETSGDKKTTTKKEEKPKSETKTTSDTGKSA
ncbi:MAG TPA: FmdB family zinc ribbon protein [Actinomycetota bacterium]|jgi:putative FmdB family regulatory protein|nr:FmdB family zinc ribbon protein [Actinomycetota bacterium]